MTPEPRHPPIVPSYGTASLADLSSSILASLDPEAPESQNVLGLAPAQRACLLIVDALGWEQLRDHPAASPFLSELALNSKPITAGFPATTATSLASLGTGRPPGQHGMLGLKVLVPGREFPAQRAELGLAGRSPSVAAAAHALRAGNRGWHRGCPCGPRFVPRHGPDDATMRGAELRPADSHSKLLEGQGALMPFPRRALQFCAGDVAIR